jgi:hypothetical protein
MEIIDFIQELQLAALEEDIDNLFSLRYSIGTRGYIPDFNFSMEQDKITCSNDKGAICLSSSEWLDACKTWKAVYGFEQLILIAFEKGHTDFVRLVRDGLPYKNVYLSLKSLQAEVDILNQPDITLSEQGVILSIKQDHQYKISSAHYDNWLGLFGND